MKILDDQKATKRNASARAVSLADELDQLAMTAWPRINYATWARRLRALAMKVCRQEADLRMARAELDARAEVITGLQAALVEMRGAVDAMKRYEYAVKNLAYNMEGCPTFGKDDSPEEPDDRDCSGCWARAATGETP